MQLLGDDNIELISEEKTWNAGKAGCASTLLPWDFTSLSQIAWHYAH
jgi:hypothetical protein